MVDVFKSHVQDVFGVIRLPGVQNSNGQSTHDEQLTMAGIRRFATQKQQQSIANKQRENKVRALD